MLFTDCAHVFASTIRNELHDWIDAEVPQMINDEIENKFDENLFDEETRKQIEAKVTAMLKEYFK